MLHQGSINRPSFQPLLSHRLLGGPLNPAHQKSVRNPLWESTFPLLGKSPVGRQFPSTSQGGEETGGPSSPGSEQRWAGALGKRRSLQLKTPYLQRWNFTKAPRSPHSSVGKESTCIAGDLGSIPGSGRFPGEGNGNPLEYSCLENPMDKGAWQATVHGVPRARYKLVTKQPPPPPPDDPL